MDCEKNSPQRTSMGKRNRSGDPFPFQGDLEQCVTSPTNPANPDRSMDSPLIKIDDKHVPLYRIVWIADLPHFCGEEDCMHEGDYEVRLDVDDSLWVNQIERDFAVKSLDRWCSDPPGPDPLDESDDEDDDPGWKP